MALLDALAYTVPQSAPLGIYRQTYTQHFRYDISDIEYWSSVSVLSVCLFATDLAHMLLACSPICYRLHHPRDSSPYERATSLRSVPISVSSLCTLQPTI